MDLPWDDSAVAARFDRYLSDLAVSLRHKDREVPFRHYCSGLLLPGDRKSVEPMAARLSPASVSAEHQSLLHFVGQSPWSSEALLDAVRSSVLPTLSAQAPVEAWIIDDTGFPKKGAHSVGVTRQYCGQLGKQDNCQVAVSLSVASVAASLPVSWRLYLPKAWAEDGARRAKAGVPEEVVFATKPQIALEQVRQAVACPEIPRGVVVADAAYGNDTEFRSTLADLQLHYVVGVQSSTNVWAPGSAPLKPAGRGKRGRPQTRLQRPAGQAPVSVKTLAEGLKPQDWHDVTWREGVEQPLTSRFAALRLRPSHRDEKRSEPWPQVWLVIEWPEGEKEPSKYWISNLPADTATDRLVYLAKLRWRIERDYQDLKQNLGLGHYEGRGWRGFHHHAALCIAAYGFLVKERCAFPPSGPGKTPRPKELDLPTGFRPRGTPNPARATRPGIHYNSKQDNRRRTRKEAKPMPMLHEQHANSELTKNPFMTQ